MSDLGISNVPSGTQDFATIPDVSVDTLATRVNPNQVATGVTRGAQVIPGSDGNPQVLMGNQATFGNGFFVAKPAKNIVTITSADDLIFNSNQNTFKIVSTLSGNFPSVTTIPAGGAGTFASNTAVSSIAHGLSYLPAFIAYMKVGNEYQLVPLRNEYGTGVQFAFVTLYVTVDSTNVNLYTTLTTYGAGSQTFTSTYSGKIYLLQETIN